MTQQVWRVLIADDDPAICTLIGTVLKKGPYEIVTCADAESALVAVKREENLFDIIICDFMLPGISGIDLIERLRADHAPLRAGDREAALGHQRKALEKQRVFSSIAPHQKRSVLILCAPGDWQANIPIDFASQHHFACSTAHCSNHANNGRPKLKQARPYRGNNTG